MAFLFLIITMVVKLSTVLVFAESFDLSEKCPIFLNCEKCFPQMFKEKMSMKNYCSQEKFKAFVTCSKFGKKYCFKKILEVYVFIKYGNGENIKLPDFEKLLIHLGILSEDVHKLPRQKLKISKNKIRDLYKQLNSTENVSKPPKNTFRYKNDIGYYSNVHSKNISVKGNFHHLVDDYSSNNDHFKDHHNSQLLAKNKTFSNFVKRKKKSANQTFKIDYYTEPISSQFNKRSFSHRLNKSRFYKLLSDLQSTQQEFEEQKCLDGDIFFSLYDISLNTGINLYQFNKLCLPLLQQILTCTRTSNQRKLPKKLRQKISNAEKYGYGTLSVLIVSLAAILGWCFYPCVNKNIYHGLLTIFISMGIGALVGDVLFHLIPESFGLHSQHKHIEEMQNSNRQEKQQERPDQPSIFKMTIIMLATIYFLFVLESLFERWLRIKNAKYPTLQTGSSIHHSHRVSFSSLDNETTINHHTQKIEQENKQMSETKDTEQVNSEPHAEHQGLRSLAIIILISDAIHNTADGLAIGSAFSSSLSNGLSTSLAVLCHEVPHELADFAILLSSGLSMKMASFYNFISALTAFVGLYTGLSISEKIVIRQWISAIVAAMFLFVALGDLMQELIHPLKKNSWKVFLLQNFGMLFGMGMMILISFYEEYITLEE